ncbi:MAG: CPBP family intramembrane metalloprotease [Treponemataceae bacterium]|nr:CPBP family intramembrane metalloprotease [Treponemataceae bacterium]
MISGSELKNEKRTSRKLPLFSRLLLILLVTVLDAACSIPLIYWWKESGVLVPSTAASVNLLGIFVQNLVTSAFPILVLIVFLVILKRSFADEMYFKIKGKISVIVVLALAAILLGITIYCLFSKHDKITVLYNLFYYVFFIAFFEEFIFRDLFPFLLKNEKTLIRYLIPGIMFGLIHVFNYLGWQSITTNQVVQFITSQMLGYIAFSCVVQFLKEKSGTIWIPVLVHAIMDYSVVFKLK